MERGHKITSVVAHIDHGKTTLIDSLVASHGFISKSLAGDLRYLDSREDEQKRGITLKLSPIKLKNNHVIIDTPGHVDFESLIYCSSILADNHLVLIDVNEGITPRTLSLVKFLNKDRCILVLNKIDRCDDLSQIELAIHQMNGLFGENLFEWPKNNLIICCASLCAGINYNLFKNNKKNTLKNAFKALKLLNERYDNDNVDDLLCKYNIRFKTKKSLFSSIFPLANSVFESIDFLYKKNSTEQIQKYSSNNAEILESRFESLTINEKVPLYLNTKFYSIKHEKRPQLLAITVYGVLKEKMIYDKNNLLFVTKIFEGSIKKGDMVYTIDNDNNSKYVEVLNIYELLVDKFVEIDGIHEPGLVYLQGDFIKNSLISSEVVEYKINGFLTPFFKTKLVIEDLSQIEKIKRTIKTISYTEQCLKAKLNRYSEIEMSCCGKVQFEKIKHDLASNGLKFKIVDPKKEFKEKIMISNSLYYRDEKIEFTIRIGPSSYFNSSGIFDTPVDHKILKNESKSLILSDMVLDTKESFFKIVKPNGNVFYIRSNDYAHIIESILEVFTVLGPLIKEEIIETYFCIDLKRNEDTKIYNVIRNELTKLYLKSNPTVCPKMYFIQASITKDYIGVVYSLLQKFYYIMEEEVFDSSTDFYVLKCHIPQFIFSDFVEDIRVSTKGTAYLEVEESNLFGEGDYNKFISSIRKEKGMFVDENIIVIQKN